MNDRLARPYREPASRDPDEPPPPTELFIESEDPESRRGSSVAMFQIFSVPPVVAVVLAGVFSPEAGLGGLVVSAVGAFVWWKRPKKDGFTFHVGVLLDDFSESVARLQCTDDTIVRVLNFLANAASHRMNGGVIARLRDLDDLPLE